jgi:ferredoxin
LRVVVDYELCDSNALCTREAPDVFRMQEDDSLVVLDATPGDELREAVERAVRACPKAALRLED